MCISFTIDDNIFILQTCVHRLLAVDSPSLDTIKMQVHFDMNYSTRGIMSNQRAYYHFRLIAFFQRSSYKSIIGCWRSGYKL